MAGWYPGKNLGRPEGGWLGMRGRRQDREHQRGVARGDGVHEFGGFSNENTQGLQGIAGQGGQGLGAGQAAQNAALGHYSQMANGQGPSVAQQQLAAAGQQNVTNQMAMAAQARGGNLASQARAAGAAGAAGAMGTQQQMAQLRAAEQQAAIGGMAGLGNTMAGQGLQQQLGAQGLLQDAYGQQMNAELAQQGLAQQGVANNRQFGLGIAQGITGAAGTGMGAAAMFSDERVKQNVQPGNMTASQTVGVLPSKTFEYQPGYGEPGQRVGQMAQDLEKTPAGAALVSDTPLGKTVDVGGLASLGVAAGGENTRAIEEMRQQMAMMQAALAQNGGLGMSQYGSLGQVGQAQAQAGPMPNGPVFQGGFPTHGSGVA